MEESEPERSDCKELATSNSSLVRKKSRCAVRPSGELGEQRKSSLFERHSTSILLEREVVDEDGVRQYLKALEAEVSVGLRTNPGAQGLGVVRCNISLSLICDNGAHAEDIDDDLEEHDEAEDIMESSEIIDSGDELNDAVERQCDDRYASSGFNGLKGSPGTGAGGGHLSSVAFDKHSFLACDAAEHIDGLLEKGRKRSGLDCGVPRGVGRFRN